jgi:hypothetical protein
MLKISAPVQILSAFNGPAALAPLIGAPAV